MTSGPEEALQTAVVLKTPLSGTRALEIVAAICNRLYLAMGMPQQPFGDLKGVSLVEMLAAVELVQRLNSDDRHRVLYVVPDDRLVAAVYALENYRVSAAAIAATITASGRYKSISCSLTELEADE